MKTLTTIFLLLSSFWCFGQADSRLFGEYSLKGKVLLEGNDSIGRNSSILVTDLTTKERAFSWFASVEPDGSFEIDRLKEGSYKLIFRINPQDYYTNDTLISVSGKSINLFEKSLRRKPCPHDAERDIRNGEMLILVADGTVVKLSSGADKKFEKRFKVQYVSIGDVVLDSHNCQERYNKKIFSELDRLHGNKWRNKIRERAIGLRTNKKNAP